jgi:o-succinylbenzoate synthase
MAWRSYRLPLVRPWPTAAGVLTEREGVLVRLTDGAWAGYGEAAPLPGYGTGELARVEAGLEALDAAIAAGRLAPPEAGEEERFAGQLATIEASAEARAAVDLAWSDLSSRRADCRLAAWWRADAASAVPVNALLVAATGPELEVEAARRVAQGFGCLKVKLGPDPRAAVARFAAARRGAGPEVTLRGDANGAWEVEMAIAALRQLEPFAPAYVEQPVPAADVRGLARVRRASRVPVAADEALLLPGGAAAVLETAAADIAILKPSVLGGPSATLALARAARAAGMAVVVTSALEAAVGRLGALHVAAAVGGGLPAGLDTGHFLAVDIAAAPGVDGGLMPLPPSPGLGVDPAGPWRPVRRLDEHPGRR